MRKLLLIGLKDVRLVFRDRAALLLMLVAPFALTIGMGFITGRFSGSSGSAISHIPVIIVNMDKGQLGNSMVDMFNSSELQELLDPKVIDSAAEARQLIDDDKFAAAVIIPAGFTDSIIPTAAMIENDSKGQGISSDPVEIEVYANPTRPTGAGVIRAVVDGFIGQVEDGRISIMTSMMSIPGIQSMPVEQIQSLTQGLLQNTDKQTLSESAIQLKTDTEGTKAVDFDPLAYLAPGMALMFLMYTVSYGGRTILQEKVQGTMPRLLISPTSSFQILGGKMLGIFLTGVAQVGILILASTLIFQVKWGDPFGIVVLIAAAVFGATGWGLLITSLARSPGQVASTGSAVMLIFGLLGGSFINLDRMPALIRAFSNITPNAWGLDGFSTLALGGTLLDIGKPLLALTLMGAVLFATAAFIFNRSNIMKK